MFLSGGLRSLLYTVASLDRRARSAHLQTYVLSTRDVALATRHFPASRDERRTPLIPAMPLLRTIKVNAALLNCNLIGRLLEK